MNGDLYHSDGFQTYCYSPMLNYKQSFSVFLSVKLSLIFTPKVFHPQNLTPKVFHPKILTPKVLYLLLNHLSH
jgi:hypothetical protein